MNGQQHYRKNTNEQERSSYIPSFFVDNIKSSSNNQFTGVSRAVGGVEGRKRPPPPSSATSEQPFQFK